MAGHTLIGLKINSHRPEVGVAWKKHKSRPPFSPTSQPELSQFPELSFRQSQDNAIVQEPGQQALLAPVMARLSVP